MSEARRREKFGMRVRTLEHLDHRPNLGVPALHRPQAL